MVGIDKIPLMKLGIILQSNKPEHAWNTFRLGLPRLKQAINMNRFVELRDNFKKYIRLYKSLYADKRTPLPAKVFLWLAVGYALLPFDLIPDFIPVLGHLDDIIIIPVFIYLALKFTPKSLYQEHYNSLFGK